MAKDESWARVCNADFSAHLDSSPLSNTVDALSSLPYQLFNEPLKIMLSDLVNVRVGMQRIWR
jgi:hypothetical protein